MTHGFFVNTGSQDAMSRTALQTVLGSRRCWKKLHGEDVWPLHLEAALIEALEQYVPDDSRETKVLGRYRGRNQFIAEYIFRQTGEHRTNKQVGSRLQQMRHCTRDPRIRELLNPARSASWASRDQRGDMEFSSFADWSEPSPVHISIPILPRRSRPTYPLPAIQALYDTSMRITSQPRPLEAITPTTTFLSPHPIVAQSWSAVVSEGQIIHTESVPLIIIPEEPAFGTGFLHSTSLVPDYWQTIVDSPDPTRFTILQEVVKDNDSTISFSAQYKFVYARGGESPVVARGGLTGIMNIGV
ncbi:TEA/ATTS domain family-domain-containing protein [Mycena metata]|uniref:TEA/ATTS domain family-domain-containing protein n=1 Tax=Mycena metata TaxID=1033252 RepID=A0AAD7K7E6_9AGAR|nr:TEA/ATTS domain family-domain-containing protein [Mycena metata]